MVNYIDGDVFDINVNVVAHQVNCKSKMFSGVAKQVTQKYPNVYREYRLFCDSRGSKALGECLLVPIGENRYIANLFGQEGYGYDGACYTSYEAIERAIKTLGRWVNAHKLSVAVPYKMSCDRGGADWTIIEGYLTKYIDDLTIVKYKK